MTQRGIGRLRARSAAGSTLAAALAALLASALPTVAQQPRLGTVEGHVTDSGGGPIVSADLALSSAGRQLTARSDSSGAYRIAAIPSGRYVLRAYRIGYEAAERVVRIQGGDRVRVDFRLTEAAVPLPSIDVEVERARERLRTRPGVTIHEIDPARLRAVPALGEADVLRAVEVLPGVVATSDFSAAFNVRGGGADENLILLDGIPIYEPFHLGGFFGVFNPDMVARAELLSGGFPARYGGRVSSVLEVESDLGTPDTLLSGGVSMLAARVALAGGTSRNARSLGLRDARARVSVRRSYFDALLRPFYDFPYHLADVQAYGTAWTAGGGRIAVTGYAGGDVLDLRHLQQESFPLKVYWTWGNQMLGSTWTRPVGGDGELRVRIGYTHFGNRIRFPDFQDTRFDSRISQGLVRLEARLPASGRITTELGLGADRYAYLNDAQSGGTTFRASQGRAWATDVYAQTDWAPSGWLLQAGLRLDGWAPAGAPAGGILSPRLAVKKLFGDDAALKLAAGRYTQPVHSLRDEELPLGIDVWILAGPRAPRVVSDQAQIGYERFFHAWHGSLEAYVRRFDGVVTNNFADDPNDPTDDVLAGTGRSWGGDLMLERRAGAVTGLLTLSYLRARRAFPDFTAGVEPAPTVSYAPIFDRRVDLDLLLRYPLPWGIAGGLRWSLGTGLPYTRPVGGYTAYSYDPSRRLLRILTDSGAPADSANASRAVVLGPRNGERYPPYHRLDLSFRRSSRHRWGRLTTYADLVNVYNRRNVLFYFYDFNASPPTRSGISMFPLLPSLGVELAF